jgi:hypothetical protein
MAMPMVGYCCHGAPGFVWGVPGAYSGVGVCADSVIICLFDLGGSDFSCHAIVVVPVCVGFCAADDCDANALACLESFAIAGDVTWADPFESVHVAKFVSLRGEGFCHGEFVDSRSEADVDPFGCWVVHTGFADCVAPSFRPPEWPWSSVGPVALKMSRTNLYVGTSTAYLLRFGSRWPVLVQ